MEAIAVVLTQGDEAALRAAVEAANGRLAEFQQIRRVLRWPEAAFPYTSTGKLMRRRVAEWACGQLSQRSAGLATGTAQAPQDALLGMIARVRGESVSGTDDTARLSEDLGLDSLGRVQLQSAIEAEMGIEIPDAAMANLRTLGDLRGALAVAAGPAELRPPRARPDRGGLAVVGGEALATGLEVRAAEAPRLASGHSMRQEQAEPSYWTWPWWRPVRLLRSAFGELVMRPLVRMLARPRVEREHAVRGPMLIVANHVTAFDVPLVLYGLPKALRRCVAVAMSGELLADYRGGRGAGSRWLDPLMPLVYWLITALFNVFPLPRFSGFRRAFEHAGEALDRGYSVLVFPEGRRSEAGELQPFRQGIGLLVQGARADVLPVALIGLGAMKARRARWFRSGRLEVRVGAPLRFDPQTEPAAITARLEAGVRVLMERARLPD
jgi:long-chain acyl-CoA synthetase